MHTITVYLAESEKRKRKRSKWVIPILVGLVAAFAFGRPKARIEEPVAVVAPPPVATVTTETVAKSADPPIELPIKPEPPPALPAHAVVTPARLDFGDGPMNRGVAPQLATLRNDGGQPIARVTARTDGPFIATNGCARGLAPGAECIVAVTFTTQQPGTFNNALTIVADSERSRISLRGNVAKPRDVPRPPTPTAETPKVVEKTQSPPPPPPPRTPQRLLCAEPRALNFTQVAKQTITLTNRETSPLRVMGIAVVGKSGQSAIGYEVDTGKCTRVLNPGQRCKFTVRATELALKRAEVIDLKVYYDDLATGERRVAGLINCAPR